MKVRPLFPLEVSLPLFPLDSGNGESIQEFSAASFQQQEEIHRFTPFDLTSHKKAREAIEFGLKIKEMGFHIFILGESRSGRMTATLRFLQQALKDFPPPPDWIYVPNFAEAHRPLPFSLPSGRAKNFQESLQELMRSICSLFRKIFSHPHYLQQIEDLSLPFQKEVQGEIEEIRALAKTKNLDLDVTPQGIFIKPLGGNSGTTESKNQINNHTVSQPERAILEGVNAADVQEIRNHIGLLTTSAHLAGRALAKKIADFRKHVAEEAIAPLVQAFEEEFKDPLEEWIQDLKNDILAHIEDFMEDDEENEGPDSDHLPKALEEKYSVNILVDHRDTQGPLILIEPNPTYMNLFGSIKYRTASTGGLETNFTMIRSGSLHRANGGILILRAEDLAKNPEVWEKLKKALRDGKIRIEEPHREMTLPLMEAPEPKAIPLNLQIILIGDPRYYYAFFFEDPDFSTFFKVKAEIDPYFQATPENIRIYAHLIYQMSLASTGLPISVEAIQYLMGYSARLAGHREQLSAKFELLSDVLNEASIFCRENKHEAICLTDLQKAFHLRLTRNTRRQDRILDLIQEGQILISTEGEAVGQINGLSVISLGDHSYGLPMRITVRTYVGEGGVVNIERLTELSGPIQQKGAFILDGFLNGTFAQRFPISCNCSLTFEQSYSGIEGDSASLAELIVILSSLADVPLSQHIALTGSVNQFGEVQAVGGVQEKIEGFYNLCSKRGLNSKHKLPYGVIIPASNILNLTLTEDVTEAVEEGRFAIWPVRDVKEALLLLTGLEAGEKDVEGNFPENSIYDRVSKKLEKYHQALLESNTKSQK